MIYVIRGFLAKNREEFNLQTKRRLRYKGQLCIMCVIECSRVSVVIALWYIEAISPTCLTLSCFSRHAIFPCKQSPLGRPVKSKHKHACFCDIFQRNIFFPYEKHLIHLNHIKVIVKFYSCTCYTLTKGFSLKT